MQRKKLRRKSKSAVVYTPAAVLLILFLSVFGVSAFLKVVEIEVTGALMYTDDEIISASGILAGDSLLLLKKSSASQKIQSAMPYISDVSLEVRLPNKVTINVTEATAIAAIGHGDSVIVLDSAGRVLERTDVMPPELIEIIGVLPADTAEGSLLKTDAGSEPRLRHMREVLAAIEREGIAGSISYLNVSNISNISFGYLELYTVVLGSSDNARYKLSSLPEIIAEIEDAATVPNETGTIIMSDREPWRWSPTR